MRPALPLYHRILKNAFMRFVKNRQQCILEQLFLFQKKYSIPKTNLLYILLIFYEKFINVSEKEMKSQRFSSDEGFKKKLPCGGWYFYSEVVTSTKGDYLGKKSGQSLERLRCYMEMDGKRIRASPDGEPGGANAIRPYERYVGRDGRFMNHPWSYSWSRPSGWVSGLR
jgi:hypothetical protein